MATILPPMTIARPASARPSCTMRPGAAWVLLAALLGLLAAPSAPAADVALAVTSAEASRGDVFYNGIRIQDEIVVANTRPVCNSCDTRTLADGVRFENYALVDESGSRRWLRSDLETFAAADPTIRTIVFVHGNQITEGDAKHEGLAVYRCVARQASAGEPIRFVIVSWPSAQVGGLLYDVRVKAGRTGPAGCQLAWLIDQLPADAPVTLVGFSFGGRIITGALQVLAGGHVAGQSLRERVHPERRPVNVVILSAAVHAHWLAPGQCHGMAMTQVDRMLLVNNCSDRAMRFYHLLERGARPQALGLRGPTRLGYDYAAKLEQRDVSRYVGSEHNLFRYLNAPGVPGQIWAYAATSGPAAGAAAVAAR